MALDVVGKRPVIDKRAEFRALFCSILRRSAPSASGERCDDYLQRLSDERPALPIPAAPPSAALRAIVLVVGGAFGDCFPPATTPFAGSVAQMRSRDLDIDYVGVSGRSSSQTNARIIEARLSALQRDYDYTRPVVLLGYSKGTVDILEAVTRYPAIIDRVSAVVSIAGAVNGSPLAERYRGLYDSWLRNRRIGSGPPGDGGVLDSLTPGRLLSWLATHPLPARIKYYFLVTSVTPPRLARVLRRPYRRLSRISARNDGQLLARDQVIPGGTLLGYANADHWGIALDLEDRFPFLAHRAVGKHPFPQQVLLTSILLFVLQDLADPAGQ